MPIKFNGTTVDAVKFNGTTLDKVIFNGVTVFESMPQLATPQNVSADGTVVSWDEVENATSYEVLADGTSIGTVTPSYKVTLTVSEIDINKREYFRVYDGNSDQGKLLYEKTGTSGGVTSPQVLSISSGRLFLDAEGTLADITLVSLSGGVAGDSVSYKITGDGALSVRVEYNF